MSGFLQCTLIGNCGRDAALRYTPAGVAVCDFSVAVNQTWGSGENKQEKLTWVKVTCWRGLAEIAHQYVKKGTQVYIQGETVEARAYTNKAGEPAASFEVTASILKLLGGKRESNQEEPPGKEAINEANGWGQPSEADLSDIPF